MMGKRFGVLRRWWHKDSKFDDNFNTLNMIWTGHYLWNAKSRQLQRMGRQPTTINSRARCWSETSWRWCCCKFTTSGSGPSLIGIFEDAQAKVAVEVAMVRTIGPRPFVSSQQTTAKQRGRISVCLFPGIRGLIDTTPLCAGKCLKFCYNNT